MEQTTREQYVKELMTIEYEAFGFFSLLNTLLERCIPLDESMQAHHKITTNLSFVLARLSSIESLKEIVLVDMLKEALRLMKLDGETRPFPTPQKGVVWDFDLHDQALSSFRKTLQGEIDKLWTLSLPLENRQFLCLFLLTFSRSLFETRQFQAPLRHSSKDAMRDSMSRDHYWREYLFLWKMNEYLPPLPDSSEEQ